MSKAPWVVILAGGDGQRVLAMTRASDGRATPKQFYRIDGRSSMLRWAFDRAVTLAPIEHVLFVVSAAHQEFWEEELRDVPRRNLLVQPRNRGTAPAVMLAALTIRMRTAPDTPVLFMPSDHYVARESVLRREALSAVDAAARRPSDILVLGVSPGEVDTQCGWILPDSAAPIAPVSQFVEKPSAADAKALVARGGLVNTFIFAAQVQTLVDVLAETMPWHEHLFRAYRRLPTGVLHLHQLYDRMPTADLSRDVLEQAPGRLAVVRVPPCGWRDLGTPSALLDYRRQIKAVA